MGRVSVSLSRFYILQKRSPFVKQVHKEVSQDIDRTPWSSNEENSYSASRKGRSCIRFVACFTKELCLDTEVEP